MSSVPNITPKAKLKLKVIMNQDFAWAMSTIMNCSLPAKASYWLSRIFKQVQSQQKHYDEARIKSLKKYANLTPDGELEVDDKNNAVFTGEKKEGFTKELNELLEEEIEITTMQFSLLGEEAKIEPRVLLLLDSVIIQPDL
jgi:hypothetical protein